MPESVSRRSSLPLLLTPPFWRSCEPYSHAENRQTRSGGPGQLLAQDSEDPLRTQDDVLPLEAPYAVPESTEPAVALFVPRLVECAHVADSSVELDDEPSPPE